MKKYLPLLLFIGLLFEQNSTSYAQGNIKKIVLTKKSKLLKKPKKVTTWHKVKLKVSDTLNVIPSNNAKYYNVSYLGKKGWVNRKKAKIIQYHSQRTKKIQNTQNNGFIKHINNNKTLILSLILFVTTLYIFLKKLFLYIQKKVLGGIKKTKSILNSVENDIDIDRPSYKRYSNDESLPLSIYNAITNFFNDKSLPLSIYNVIKNLFFALFLIFKAIFIEVFIISSNIYDNKEEHKPLIISWFRSLYVFFMKRKVISIGAFSIFIFFLIINQNSSKSNYPKSHYNYKVPIIDVDGYYKSNGTYVKPHKRSKADGIPYNNFGYPGNYNPNKEKITGGSQKKYLQNYYKGNNNKVKTSQKTGNTIWHSDGSWSTQIDLE